MQSKSLIYRALFLTLALFSLCGCGKDGAGVSSVLAGTGLRMAGDMRELASSDTYVQMMCASDALTEIVFAMGRGDYTTPRAIYSVAYSEDELFTQLFGGKSAEFSNELRLWIEKRAYASVPAQICGYFGAPAVAAASSFSYSESFVCPELTSPALYLYQFDGEYSTMVSFVPGRDGAVSATSLFIPNDGDLDAAASAAEIAAWIDEKTQLSEVTAEKIEFK